MPACDTGNANCLSFGIVYDLCLCLLGYLLGGVPLSGDIWYFWCLNVVYLDGYWRFCLRRLLYVCLVVCVYDLD